MRTRTLFIASLLALACASRADPPLPAALSEMDHLRLENALLKEAQVCRPVQEQRAALLRELEGTYRFSLSKGDTIESGDLKTILRKSSATPAAPK